MAHSARILPNYTYDDYLLWEGEWEIIDGIPYAMSPMASPRHQWIAGQIHTAFENEIRIKSCNCRVYQPIDLKIDEATVVHPDLLIVCKPIEKQFLDFPPDLVVEILSPSTRLKDQVTKLALYQDFGIRYYLIVDPETNTITYYELINEKYQKMKKPSVFEVGDGCSISPTLENIWS